MKGILLFTILITVSIPGTGQSLSELITLAANDNARLQALDLDYNSARQKINQVNAFPDPTLSLGLGVLPVETRLGPQRVRLGVNQQIPWPGLRGAKSGLAEAEANIRSTARSEALLDVAYQIKVAYYNISTIEEKTRLINDNLAILSAMRSLAQTRVEGGSGRLSDILQIELKVQELEGMIELLEEEKHKHLITINRLTYRDLDTPVEITEPFQLVNGRDLSSYEVNNDHPSLLKLSLAMTASEKAIELTDYQSKPKIGVGLDYILVGQRNDADPVSNGRDILMPMGSISIPLNTRQFEARREEEKLKIMALDKYKTDIENGFQAEISVAYRELEKAAIAFRLYEELYATNATSIDLLETAYAAAEVSIDELIRLYTDQVNYQIKQTDAILQSLMAKASIEKFTE